MADRPIKLREPKAILARHGVSWRKNCGKGSHLLLEKAFPEGVFSYPMPTHDADIKVCYVQGCRKKFRFRAADGVTDREFYGK